MTTVAARWQQTDCQSRRSSARGMPQRRKAGFCAVVGEIARADTRTKRVRTEPSAREVHRQITQTGAKHAWAREHLGDGRTTDTEDGAPTPSRPSDGPPAWRVHRPVKAPVVSSRTPPCRQSDPETTACSPSSQESDTVAVELVGSMTDRPSQHTKTYFRRTMPHGTAVALWQSVPRRCQSACGGQP